MDLADLPIIDWDLGLKLAGNQKELAADMIRMVGNTLPTEMANIEALHAAQDYPELTKRVHKLHGAVSYCGLPRLKSVLLQLETQLKSNEMKNVPMLLERLAAEVRLVLEHPSLQ